MLDCIRPVFPAATELDQSLLFDEKVDVGEVSNRFLDRTCHGYSDATL